MLKEMHHPKASNQTLPVKWCSRAEIPDLLPTDHIWLNARALVKLMGEITNNALDIKANAFQQAMV